MSKPLTLDDLSSKVSKTTRRLNPGVFGQTPAQHCPRLAARARAKSKPQPSAANANEGADCAQLQGSQGVAGRSRLRSGAGPVVRVVFTAFRRKILDDDNYRGGLKALRDAIAGTLELDDAEQFIEWEYHQVETTTTQGVSVRIEEIR